MRTFLYPLPLDCKGYIIKDPYTGDESIVLNANHTYEQNRKTYLHELAHHQHKDLDSDVEVGKLELLRHLKEG